MLILTAKGLSQGACHQPYFSVTTWRRPASRDDTDTLYTQNSTAVRLSIQEQTWYIKLAVGSKSLSKKCES